MVDGSHLSDDVDKVQGLAEEGLDAVVGVLAAITQQKLSQITITCLKLQLQATNYNYMSQITITSHELQLQVTIKTTSHKLQKNRTCLPI
jgi:hypothetical protein